MYGKVLLSHAAIYTLHTLRVIACLPEPVKEAPEFQEVVHTK